MKNMEIDKNTGTTYMIPNGIRYADLSGLLLVA